MLQSTVAATPATGSDTLDALEASLLLSGLTPERFDPRRVGESLGYFPPPRSTGQHTFDGAGVGIREGRTFTLSVGPGVVSVVSCDLARVERAIERAGASVRAAADLAARRLLDVPLRACVGSGDGASRRVTAWSPKSRSRMVRAFGEVDWSALLDAAAPLGLVTLTYPGDWLAVAPNGKAVKRHMRVLQLRFKRAVGHVLRGAWKLEFQRRGAPHVHIIMPVPAMVKGLTFEAWLAESWARIVQADWCGAPCHLDPETGRVSAGAACCEGGRHRAAGTAVDFASTAKMTDPKRLAVYFLKHSAKTGDDKEYQHIVPEAWAGDGDGPGRFWGFWGMTRVVGALELDLDDFVTARRVMRGAMRGRARRVAHDRAYHAARRRGVDHLAASVIARDAADRAPKRWTLGSSGAMTGGFLVVNDGPALALGLARSIRLRREWLDDRGL